MAGGRCGAWTFRAREGQPWSRSCRDGGQRSVGVATPAGRVRSSIPCRVKQLVLLALLALAGCSFATWTCQPGGGVLTGKGGCRVLLVRAFTDVDVMVVALGDDRTLVMGSRVNVAALAAVAAAALVAHQAPQPATRHPFDDRPPAPRPKPTRR